MEKWAVLVDKGYQRGNDVARLLHPVRRPPNGFLSLVEKEQNLDNSRGRIFVENYFERLKCLWQIMSNKYIWDESFYDVFSAFVCALRTTI